MTRLTRNDAAKFLTDLGLPIAPTTLAKKAVDGSGPPYQLWNGQATYDDQDLLTWATSRLGPKLRSTAERRAAPTSQTSKSVISPQKVSSFPHQPSGPQSNEEAKEERNRRSGSESETRRRPR
jgi:hypothetical protein